MAIRYSYGNYTTKGHGIIEGYYSPKVKTRKSRRKKRKVHANKPVDFTRVKVIPEKYVRTEVLADVTPYIQPFMEKPGSKMNRIILRQLLSDIRAGITIYIAGRIIAYSKKLELYEVYRKLKTGTKSTKPRRRALLTGVSRKQQRKANVASAYEQLLAIQQKAKRKRQRANGV